MLSVEWNAINRAVSVVMNEEGVALPMKRCHELLADRDHIHLCRGQDLTDSGIFEGVFGELVLEFRELEEGELPPHQRQPIVRCE